MDEETRLLPPLHVEKLTVDLARLAECADADVDKLSLIGGFNGKLLAVGPGEEEGTAVFTVLLIDEVDKADEKGAKAKKGVPFRAARPGVSFGGVYDRPKYFRFVGSIGDLVILAPEDDNSLFSPMSGLFGL